MKHKVCHSYFISQQVEAALYNIHEAAPTSVKVIRDKFTGVSRGFCFVEYSTKEVGNILLFVDINCVLL